jgi:c-di-GMP-binding flagellar brake protein YcgR
MAAPDPPKPDALAARAHETGQLLVRSGTEIASTLRAMCEAREVLSVDLESDEHLFMTRLLEVDAQGGSMTVGWSDSKEGNALVLARPSVTFSANHGGLHLQFAGEGPHEVACGGASAIRLSLPKALFAVQRRVLPRYKVPPSVPLKCEISLGPVSFDALVVDVSLGGIGAIVYDPAIRLDVGMTIPRARILLPAHAPVLAALEVRNVRTVTRAGGRVLKRAGCRFIAPATGIEALIRLFVAAIEGASR